MTSPDKIMPKISGIYSIVCATSGRVYIGSSIDIDKRFGMHRWRLVKNRHFNKFLQSEWNKYGEDNFAFGVIEHVEFDKLIERELFWISESGLVYNFRLPDPAQKKWIVSQEIKKKISESNKGRLCWNKGRHWSQEVKDKISKAHMGKKKSAEAVRKSSSTQKGRPAPNKGIPHSAETRAKISKARMGCKMSEEFCRKNSERAKQTGSGYRMLEIAGIRRAKNRELGYLQTAEFLAWGTWPDFWEI